MNPDPSHADAILDAAFVLASEGHPIVFCHAPLPERRCTCRRPACSSQGKHPILARWQREASTDHHVIRDQRARFAFEPNVGIALGARRDGSYLIAIDIDDQARYESLAAEHGALPETLTTTSARGWRGLYRLVGPTDRARNRTAIGGSPGVDAKVGGGQIVAPPSLHASGVRYAWREPRSAPAELPAAWTLLLLDPLPVPPQFVEYTPARMREDSKARRRAEKYLEGAVTSEAMLVARAVEGGRNSALHQALCRCLTLASGVSLPESYVIRELSRASALPGAEIARTVESVRAWVARERPTRSLPPVSLLPHVAEPPQPSAAAAAPPEPPIDLILDGAAPAKIAENVARVLEQDSAWGGGPRLDRYSGLRMWSRPLPAPVALHDRAGLEIRDADYDAILSYCHATHGLKPGLDNVVRGARLAAARHPMDSLSDWIATLPVWDGTERIETWTVRYLDCADTPYHRVTGRAWLRAAMFRAKTPGALVDIVPILQGAQEIGKNHAIETLFSGGPEGAPWLENLCNWEPNDRETQQLSCSRWILHDDENRSRGKVLDVLKSWVSRQQESWVAKWETDRTVAKRRALLVISTDGLLPLHDPAGNRRWIVWVVATHARIDIEAIARDRLQLFAEALLDCENWRQGLSDVAIERREVAAEATVEDPLSGSLHKLLRSGQWESWLLTSQIYDLIGFEPSKRDRALSMRLADTMRSMGAESRRTRTGERAYRMPPSYLHTAP